MMGEINETEEKKTNKTEKQKHTQKIQNTIKTH